MDLLSSSPNDSFGDDDSIHDYSFAPLQDPELLLAAYTRAFNIRMMKSEEENADESWPVERRELVYDDSHSKPQLAQKKDRVTPDQAIFNYLYQQRRNDLLETMFDEETCMEYTTEVEQMGAAMPQIQRMYAYYCRNKPVKKEAVEKSSDSRRGVVELDNEESGNDDPKRRPQSTPTENGALEHAVKDSQQQQVTNPRRSARLRARSVVKKPVVVGVEDEESSNEDPKQQSTPRNKRKQQRTPREDARTITRINKSKEAQEANDRTDVRRKKKRVKDSRKVQLSSDQAVFYYFHERKRSDVLDALFNENTRQEHVNKVKEVVCEMPSIMRMYAHWRRIELKKTIKDAMEIWKCQACKKQQKTSGQKDLLEHIGTHERISSPCVVEHCGRRMKPRYMREHLKRFHARHYDEKARTQRNKYFPPEAFLRFDDKKFGNTQNLEDPKCRECGKVVRVRTTRRYHVAQHLKLSYKCMIDDCEFRSNPMAINRHISQYHSKKVGQLTAGEFLDFKLIKDDFNKTIGEEFHKFFTCRNNKPVRKRVEAKDKRASPNDMNVTPQLAIFYYLYERKRRDVLEAIFDEETWKEFASKVEKMGIDMPSILRTYAYWRRIELKKTSKGGIEIWKCHLCKKETKAFGPRNLLNHIGTHEVAKCPCVVEDCNTLVRPDLFRSHLKKVHALHVDHLGKKEYHKLRLIERSCSDEARTKRNKYFPPEAFLRFDDKKIGGKTQFEDPKCRECGQMVRVNTTRRAHVAQHLNLLYKCVVDGCEFRINPRTVIAHLSTRHSKKVAQLTAEELFELKRIRADFRKVMERELNKFFPYKEEISEDHFGDFL
ncbi:hypothetical protein QR680_007051 [Steinernema hermaphroditum]|uniref:C2H2-type domain-containing protein n=1 Tax=Steinernema hermaphroditum TaxID=289476 RepID=A0AA39HXE0_9BILA|nr:hypothetical protein QR680_007051 [Steinernema hermaphroditum]